MSFVRSGLFVFLSVASVCVCEAKRTLRYFDYSNRSWEGGNPSEAGFYVRDARIPNSCYKPLAQGADEAKGLEFSFSKALHDDAEFFDLTIRDTTGNDRALTLTYLCPLPEGEVVWHADPRSNVVVRTAQRTLGNFYSVRDVGRRALSRHPLVAVSAERSAYAIGLDLEYPAFFRVAVDPGLKVAYISWDIAFVKGKQSAQLKFAKFPFEAAHGFRGALETYQKLYPQHWVVRVKKQGSLLSFTNASKIPNCEDFGFRFKEAIYEPDYDDRHDILTFHYEEPVLWWMKKPGKQLSMQVFIDEANRLADAGDIRARGWRDSVFRGQDGSPLGYIRNMYWCDGIGWSVNTSPYLPGTNTDFYVRHGDGKFESRYRKDWTPENPRGIDGEFIDSSEPFQAHQMDYCRERFVYMKAPLCWCSTNAVPGIYKGMIAFENAQETMRRCRAIGRYVYANSTPNRWCWMPPNMDAMCREVTWVKKDGSWRPDESEIMMRRRMLCGGKSYTLVMNCDYDLLTAERMEKYMNHSLAYGFFPGLFSAAAHGKKNKERYFRRPELYERDRPLFKKYIPLIRTVAEAGWRPVNRLFPIDSSTGIFAEQFGDRYVTLFNPSPAETLRLKVPNVRELTTGTAVGGELVLPPETCRVLDFN